MKKCDQIAWYCETEDQEAWVKKLFGLQNKVWITDHVVGISTVWGSKIDSTNEAMLQFNYDLGIELELIHYIKGDHWHNPFGVSKPGPFLSHIGIHLDDGEDFPAMEGCRLAQETFTISHTSEYLTTGAGAGRKYHYRIYELAPQTFIKYIRRIPPP